MSETAGLQIKVEHTTARDAADSLDRLRASSRGTEEATEALREATRRFAGELDRAARAAEESAAAQRRIEEEMRRQRDRDREEEGRRTTASVDAQKKREFEIVRQSLRSQEEAIRESYLKQRKIIEESGAPKATQLGLTARLDARQAAELAKLREKENAPAEQARKELAAMVASQQAKQAAIAAERAKEDAARRAADRAEFEEVKRFLRSEEQAIKESYARRRQMVRMSVVDSNEQQRLIKALNAKEKGDLREAKTPGTLGQLGGYIAPLIGVGAALGGLYQVVSVTREFEKLHAGLITATGSARDADLAFEALQDKAAETPYSLREVTDSFVKLVNYGLQPSERAITSYGNTSSALGKDITQMIEAVADATQGEYERLKEFGIKASSQGDKITFMFRGVRTTVAKNSKEIQDYLIRLGETNFGDAMANRMNTLDGKISNLGDAWDQLFRTIGNGNVGGLMRDSVDTGIAALGLLTEAMQSETMRKAVSFLSGSFTGLAYTFHKVYGTAKLMATGDHSSLEAANYAFNSEIDRMVKEQMEAEAKAKAAAAERKLTEELKSAEKNLASMREQAKRGLIDKDVLNAAEEGVVKMRSSTAEAVETTGAIATAAEKLASLKQRSADIIESLVAKGATKKAAQAEVKRQIAEADASFEMLVGKYGNLIHKSKLDRLSGYEKTGGSKGPTAAEIAQAKKDAEEFKQLQKKLQSEEDAIRESYDRRQKLIDRKANRKNGEWERMSTYNVDQMAEDLSKTEAAKAEEESKKALEDLRKSMRSQGEVLREGYRDNMKIVEESGATDAEKEALVKRITAKYDAEVVAQEKAENDKLQSIRDSFLTEMELFKQQQEQKKQAILESTATTEEERQDLLAQLQKQTDERMAAEEDKRNKDIAQSSADLFDGLAKTAKNLGAENSATYRALFTAAKAFNVTKAGMDIASAEIEALKLPWPANIAAQLGVAAQGAALLAVITSANYSGAMDAGGSVPAGNFAIVGEKRPEIVWGPATVTGGRDTARMMAAQSSAAATPLNLKIVTAPDMNTAAKHLATTEGERVILAIAAKHASELRTLIGGR